VADWLNREDVWSEPTTQSVPTYSAAYDVSMTLPFLVTDREGGTISTSGMTFTASGLPDGLSVVGTATGFKLTGTPSQTALAAGTYSVIVTATDGVSDVSASFFFVVAAEAQITLDIKFRIDANTNMFTVVGVPQQNFLASLVEAKKAMDEGKTVLLDLASIKAITRFLLDGRIHEFIASQDAQVAAAYKTTLSNLQTLDALQFKTEIAFQLEALNVTPEVEPEMTPAEKRAEQVEIKKHITDLADDDFEVREAATIALKGLSTRIFRQLQTARAGITDSERRRLLGEVLDHALSERHPLTLRHHAFVELAKLNNQVKADLFDYVKNLTKGAPDAYGTVLAASSLKKLQRLRRTSLNEITTKERPRNNAPNSSQRSRSRETSDTADKTKTEVSRLRLQRRAESGRYCAGVPKRFLEDRSVRCNGSMFLILPCIPGVGLVNSADQVLRSGRFLVARLSVKSNARQTLRE